MKIEYSFVEILTGSDLSRRKLPLMSIKSNNPGPVIWLCACGHGDEVGGLVVVQEVFKKLAKGLLKGSVYAFPLMNPTGFENASRYVSSSEEDLNRSFPGDKEGSLAERLSEKIFSSIKNTRPDFVLDLHNDWRQSIPYVLIDPEKGVNKDIYKKTEALAKKIGFPVILDDNIEKTLSYSLLKDNIPAISVELGESNVVNEKNVNLGVQSILNVINHLGMFDETEKIDLNISGIAIEKILRYSAKPSSSTSGVLRFLVKPGDIVKKGEEIAKVYNAFGKLLETIRALDDALVLGYSDYSVAFPGSPVMAFGVI